MRKTLPCLLLLAALSCQPAKKLASIDRYRYTTVKTATGRHGAVVSAHPLASAVGLSILQQGGNAFDAAIATQLALAVVYPNAGNIGGGGFMVAHLANGTNLALDYRETAPASATANMYLDKDGNVVAGRSINGHLSSGVPGTVAGLFATARYGKLPFSKLIEPAILLANEGFALTPGEAASLNGIQKALHDFNTQSNAFERTEWRAGDTLIQSQLANTLRRIRDGGATGFYEGPTARMIVEEMQRGGGLLTLADLKNYAARWREPHVFDYRGHTVVGMPMPSSGGTLLHQMMKMIEDRLPRGDSALSSRTVQLVIEAERRAFADRAEYMGDADFYQVPQKALTDPAYLAGRMKDYRPGIAGSSETVRPGQLPKESEQTTHLNVIDAEGNAVSITTTLNNSYGSKTVVGGAGFFMNDEMDDFSAKPGAPNLYGAVGGAANAIAPGKRMLSSMTPTLVLANGKPYIVAGTPGGTTIPTSVLQTLIDILDFGLDARQAVDLPKYHHQWLPDQVEIEKTFPQALRSSLKGMGYRLNERSSIGRTEVIVARPDGTFLAVADSRGDDGAAAY